MYFTLLIKYIISFIIFFTTFNVSSKNNLDEIFYLYESGKNTEALVILKKKLSDEPDNKNYLFLKGLIFTKLERNEEAIKIFKKLHEAYPTMPEPLNNLAVLYFSQGKSQNAIEMLQKAINTNNSYSIAYQNLSEIYKSLANEVYISTLKSKDVVIAKKELTILENILSYDKVAKASLDDQKKEEFNPDIENSKSQNIQKETNIDTIIRDRFNIWLRSWVSQDIETYLSLYSKKIKNSSSEWEAWSKERANKIKGPKQINIDISNLKIVIVNASMVSVNFLQEYKSNYFTSKGYKELLFVKENQDWFISKETFKGRI